MLHIPVTQQHNIFQVAIFAQVRLESADCNQGHTTNQKQPAGIGVPTDPYDCYKPPPLSTNSTQSPLKVTMDDQTTEQTISKLLRSDKGSICYLPIKSSLQILGCSTTPKMTIRPSNMPTVIFNLSHSRSCNEGSGIGDINDNQRGK